MGRKQCILCQNIYSSKQEMDEHMRSMLHHRELENLKGRDCGHECRVCKVTVASLTDYANHISSPLHKQRVTAQELGSVQGEEEYFDKELVNLIEKRKEQIRQEEAAAKRAQEEARRAKEEARRAKEEEERRRKMQQLQKRWNEANQYVRRKGASWGLNSTSFQPPAKDVRGSDWNGSNSISSEGLDVQEDPRNWHQQNRQGKSATWHAQEPPNFQSWGPGQRSGGSLHSRGSWASKRCDQEGISGHPRLSIDGSTISGYNSLQWQQTKQPVVEGLGSGHMMDFTNDQVCPSSLFSNMEGQYQQREGGHENREGPSTERDRNNGIGPKTGSNPKLDKAFRWTPYPPTSKHFDSAPHKDSHPNPSEKFPKGPPPHAGVVRDVDMISRCKPAPDPITSERQSRWDQQQRGCSTKGSGSNSRSSSAQRDSHASSSSGPPKQKPAVTDGAKGHNSARPPQARPSSSPNPNPKNQLSSASSQDSLQPKSSKHSGSNPKSHKEALPSEQEQQLSEMLRKAKETLLPYKRCFVDLSTDHRMETVLHIEEEPPVERAERKAQEHKRSSSNQSVQSVQVSTSAVETRGTAPSARLEEECREGSEGGGSEDAGPGLDGEAQTSSSLGAGVTAANKAGLPPALKRDLTKHISSKSKAGGHEPNLNIARRIRNLSGARRADAEKDSGLKPTVRQLISSSGSRRNVNWEQVYQEVCRKKQEQGKGMPRFGIEMVSCEQEGLSQEEDDIPLTEGFQWESFISVPPAGISPVTTRKRSLSESSIAPESSLFTSKTSGPRAAMVEGPSRPGRRNSEQQGVSSTLATPVSRYGNRGKQQTEDGVDRQLKARSQTLDEGPPGASQQQPDSVVVDSSSGAEQNDAHGSGKKRRAAGDVPSPEIPFLEKTNKRRKTKKSKKERSQVDQLLAVSLREEELSLDLQTLDNSLIQARAALQVAYIEVQRLLMVKQQVNMEMSTLRSKRIELLQGMQGGLENAPSPRVKEMEEEMALAPAEPHMPLLLSPTTDAAVPSPSQAPQGPVCTSPPPPSSSVDAFTQSVVIKQEPLSPVRVDSELDPVGSIVHRAHSSTPESALIPSPSDPALPCQPVTVLTRRLSQSLGEPADWKESSTSGKAVQTVQMGLLAAVDSKPPSFLSPASRRGSQALTPTDPAASPPHETLPSPPACPPSPPELRSGKRVRKLKKKKRDPRKSQGAEQPDSDTELDGETSRPTRRLHLRRRSSGFQVSTSTSPNATLDDGARERGEDAPGAASPAGEPGQEDSDSTVEVVEPRQVAQVAAVNVDTSDSNMDISPASHESEPSCQPTAPDTGKEQPQTLACNEVSSTSEMEVSAVIKTCDSDIRLPLTSLKVKTSSADVPSDCGEDKPTEGAFEGHQETVNAMQVHNGMLYTCSGDRTVKAFNLRSRKCVAVFEGHSTKVNCLVVSSGPRLPQRLYSGSSDQTIRCYSLRTRLCVEQFSLPDRVLCLHSRWNVLYAGLANGSVATFNLKTNKQVDVFECHGPRAVSCLASAQEGARRILLVGSFDSTISVRDAKTGLLLRTLEGHTKTVLCMEVVSDLVFSGSSDQSVHAHNIHTGQLVRIYKGHSHGVTVVAMLGKVMVTACLDKLVRVYELQSHEQLQVYNGHSDMVMCMTIHQSMIYTGCYDGSVQAVKLNLIQNHRCLWHGCSLIFGVQEHLHQHLLSDHAGPNVPLLKCRWKNCDAFFSARNGSKQGMPKHMQAHVEECQSEC